MCYAKNEYLSTWYYSLCALCNINEWIEYYVTVETQRPLGMSWDHVDAMITRLGVKIGCQAIPDEHRVNVGYVI